MSTHKPVNRIKEGDKVHVIFKNGTDEFYQFDGISDSGDIKVNKNGNEKILLQKEIQFLLQAS